MNKYLLILAALGILASGCKSSTPNPVLTALDSAVCDVETTITGAVGAAIVNACKGTGTTAACGAGFQSALGNVNLCAMPLPSTLAGTGAKTIGSITQSQIDAAKKAGVKSLAPMGIVGSIACPIAVNTGMGYLTAQIPLACGCTISLTASEADADLTAACIAAIPL